MELYCYIKTQAKETTAALKAPTQVQVDERAGMRQPGGLAAQGQARTHTQTLLIALPAHVAMFFLNKLYDTQYFIRGLASVMRLRETSTIIGGF